MSKKQISSQEALTLIKNNIFLSADEKTFWTDKVDQMSDTELLALIELLKKNEEKLGELVKDKLKATNSGLLKEWEAFKKNQSNKSTDLYHKKEQKKADEDLLKEMQDL